MTPKDYNTCVELYSDRLFRFILKNMKNEADARDVVQNAFEILWKKREGITPEKARSFLFTVGHNNMIDILRKVKRMDYVERIPEKSGPSGMDNFALKELLNNSINQLNDLHRSLVLLRDYEGYSYKEIAKITQLTESQVKVYIFRARKKLQEILVSVDRAL